MSKFNYKVQSKLVRAIQNNDQKGVLDTLENGAKLNSMLGCYFPLEYFKQQEMFELLVEKGANINQTHGVSRYSLLHRAVFRGDLEMLELLVKAGADVNAWDVYEQTPLFIACKNNYPALVEFLIKCQGIELHAKNNLGWAPIHIACLKGSYKVIALLAPKLTPIEVNDQDVIHQIASPLHLAVKGNYYKSTEILLKYKANVNVRDFTMSTVLHSSMQQYNLKIMQLLVKHGADVNDYYNGIPLLHEALKNYNTNIIQFLIKNYANLGAEDWKGCNILHYLVHDINLFKFFYYEGVNVTYDHLGQTPLHFAALGGNLPVIDFLINEGLDVNINDNLWTSPLQFACFSENYMAVEFLIEKRANVNNISIYGDTSINTAVRLGNVSIIELLIKNGVYIADNLVSSIEQINELLDFGRLERFVDLLLKNNVEAEWVQDAFYKNCIEIGEGEKGEIEMLLENKINLAQNLIKSRMHNSTDTKMIQNYCNNLTRNLKSLENDEVHFRECSDFVFGLEKIFLQLYALSKVSVKNLDNIGKVIVKNIFVCKEDFLDFKVIKDILGELGLVGCDDIVDEN